MDFQLLHLGRYYIYQYFLNGDNIKKIHNIKQGVCHCYNVHYY